MSISLPSFETRWEQTTRRQNEMLKGRLIPPPPQPGEVQEGELRQLMRRLDPRAVGLFVTFLLVLSFVITELALKPR